MRLIRQSGLVILLFATFGCTSIGDPYAEALDKAASDLNCPNDQVWVTSLGNNKYRASGCGRYIAYENYGPRTLTSLGGR
jgi:hypothetical protein